MRWRISAAAASVNVTIRISSRDAGGFSSSRQLRHRSTSVCVLPVPAPATTNTLPRAATACCWAAVKLISSQPAGCASPRTPATPNLPPPCPSHAQAAPSEQKEAKTPELLQNSYGTPTVILPKYTRRTPRYTGGVSEMYRRCIGDVSEVYRTKHAVNPGPSPYLPACNTPAKRSPRATGLPRAP